MATVNYIPYKKQSAFTLRGMIQYACLKEKTLLSEGYRLITGHNCCAETAVSEFLSTKAQHKRTGDMQFYHYTQSFKVGENISPQIAHEIACEFARKNYPNYEVLISTHIDAPQKLKASAANVDAFIEKAKRYTTIDKLTPELLRLFIQRIEIGERAKKHSHSSGQSIRIIYRDIGVVDSTMQDGEREPHIAAQITSKEEIIRMLA